MAELELHFGAGLALGVHETAKQARWMEELGYEYISCGEHFMRGDPPGPTHAALPVLAVAAGATEKLRILSSIILTPFYHPLVLARMTATLDAASNGRLTLGVGVGGEFPMEFDAADLKLNQRGSRTDECLNVLKQLWTGDRVSFSGKHFRMSDAMINPGPVQQPNPPIWVSGRRDAAMARAAQYGDGWMPYFYDPPRYSDSVHKINAYAAAAGRDMTNFQWTHFPYISIYPTEQQAAEVAAEQLGGRYLYNGDFLDIVRKYCLLGPVENCIEQLQKYIDAGARHIIFSISCPREDRARHIEIIAKELIPHFQSS